MAPNPPKKPVDSDGDGLSDVDEAYWGTDPLSPNSAHRELSDSEFVARYALQDRDGDGLSDADERRLRTNPNAKDTDRDGLMDAAEVRLHTDPRNWDSDGDQYRDGLEVVQHQDPLSVDAPYQHGYGSGSYLVTDNNLDADGLDDRNERLYGTKPDDPDSDNDGLGDDVEVYRQTNPNSPYGAAGDKTTDLDDVERELQVLRAGRANAGEKSSAIEDTDGFDRSEGDLIASADSFNDPSDFSDADSYSSLDMESDQAAFDDLSIDG